jgi:hypothetical protein
MVTPNEFIDPKEIEIDKQSFTYSRIPAFYAAEIYDKIVERKGIIPQDVKLEMLSRCCVNTENGKVVLDKSVLVDTYIKKFQTLRKLIDTVFEYNFGFFDDGDKPQE